MLKLQFGKELKDLPNKKRKKTLAPKRIKQKETSQILTEESSDTGSVFKTSTKDRSQQEEKDWESFDE